MTPEQRNHLVAKAEEGVRLLDSVVRQAKQFIKDSKTAEEGELSRQSLELYTSMCHTAHAYNNIQRRFWK